MEKINGKRHEIGKGVINIIGAVFVIAGLLLIVDQLNIFAFRFRDIVFTWQAILVVLGLIFLSKREGKLTGIVLLLIGILFLMPRFILLPVNMFKLLWPAALVFVGLLILFKGTFRKGFGISSGSAKGDVIEDVNRSLACFQNDSYDINKTSLSVQ